VFISTVPRSKLWLQNDVKPVQRDLEATLILVFTKGDPYPVPGRAIRNVASSCFILLYTLGESRTAFETLLACLKVLGDVRAPADRDLHKMCVHLFYFYGDKYSPKFIAHARFA
jgi:hypothetical protein